MDHLASLLAGGESDRRIEIASGAPRPPMTAPPEPGASPRIRRDCAGLLRPATRWILESRSAGSWRLHGPDFDVSMTSGEGPANPEGWIPRLC